MQGTDSRSRRIALAWSLVLALVAAPRPATAYSLVQLDAAVNAGYSEVEGRDAAGPATEAFTDVRPALTLSLISPRMIWRAAYVFSGHLALTGERLASISNAVEVAMAAELSNRSAVIVSGGVSQGGTAFQLTQKAAEAGQPAFRARTSAEFLTASLSEAYSLQASQQLRLGQSLMGSLVAPQEALGTYNATVGGTLSLQRELHNAFGQLGRDAVGAELQSSASMLRLASNPNEPYWSIHNALVARWNHDFTWNWNGQATAGVEQVLTFTGSYPLAVLPTGAFTLQYSRPNAGATLTATYGATADLNTGTISIGEGVTLRGLVAFETAHPLSLGASAGFLHAQPLGQSATSAAAGTGSAAQGDVGLFWGLSEGMLATARYTIAYQFDQPRLTPMLTHVLFVGLTMRYSNGRRMPPAPTFGARVDGSDRVGFSGGSSGKP